MAAIRTVRQCMTKPAQPCLIIDPAEAERREQRLMLGAVGVFFLMVLSVLFLKGFHLFGW